MAGDKIGVQMRLNNMLDGDVPLGWRRRYRSTSRCGSITAAIPSERDQIRRLRKAAKIELLKDHSEIRLSNPWRFLSAVRPHANTA